MLTVGGVAAVGLALGTVVVFLLLAALGGESFARLNPTGDAPAIVAATPKTTTISLTFDDGHSSSWTGARPVLRSNGVNATFYINTGMLDTPEYMSSEQVQQLGAEGDDIGGHTLHHPRLPTLTHDQSVTEICEDRANLQKLGFADPSSFAYPYGDVGSDARTMEKIPADCGYASARTTSGVSEECNPAAPAETLPPRNRYELRIVDTTAGILTADKLKAVVSCAQKNGGGWVPIMMHDVCDQAGSPSLEWRGTETCGADSFGPISPAELDTLIKWAKRQPDIKIRVVSAVMADVSSELGSGGRSDNAPTTAGPAVTPANGGRR